MIFPARLSDKLKNIAARRISKDTAEGFIAVALNMVRISCAVPTKIAYTTPTTTRPNKKRKLLKNSPDERSQQESKKDRIKQGIKEGLKKFYKLLHLKMLKSVKQVIAKTAKDYKI